MVRKLGQGGGLGGGLGGGSERPSVAIRGSGKRFLDLEEVWEVDLGRSGEAWEVDLEAVCSDSAGFRFPPPLGNVWPVPGGGEAASLLGTSPEQRKRSIPWGSREPEASGWLRFPSLWETSVWCVMCGMWCVMCVVLCCVVLCCVVLCCAVLCCVVLC